MKQRAPREDAPCSVWLTRGDRPLRGRGSFVATPVVTPVRDAKSETAPTPHWRDPGEFSGRRVTGAQGHDVLHCRSRADSVCWTSLVPAVDPGWIRGQLDAALRRLTWSASEQSEWLVQQS